MYPSTRQSCCGFNVAKNCVGGPALLIGIPLLVIVHMKTVVLTPFFVERRANSHVLMEVLLEWLFCTLGECCLFLLLVTDPGFIEEPTELSCRCPDCKMEVEDFDHHCDAVGVCIGKGNMCYFILFLFFASLLCLIGGMENATYIMLSLASIQSENSSSSMVEWETWRTSLTAWASSTRHVCLLLLSVAAIYGGAVCIFLCLRYVYLACVGRSSVRRRRRKTQRGSLSLVFANVFRPQFSHNYRFTTVSAAEEMSDLAVG